MSKREIIHVDMDAFYASVEKLDNPNLKNKPVIVGGLGNRGVVSTASYEARKFGVHSAQPMAKARRLCPQAVFLSPRFDRYKEVSNQIREIFHQYTPIVEPISLDEAFLDVTGSKVSAVKIAKKIKEKIKKTTNLTCSVGIGHNKFLAKLCSDLDKPNGFTVIKKEGVNDFLKDLDVTKIWGVGEVSEKKLKSIGVHNIGDLRRIPLEKLKQMLGKYGKRLYKLARGIDKRPVEPEREIKSISREVTFENDLHDYDKIVTELYALSESVGQRLRKNGFQGRTIRIKVRFPDFTTITRQITLNQPTSNTEIISKHALGLFERKVELKDSGIRLLGVGVTNLSNDNGKIEGKQLTFFDEAKKHSEKLDKVIDQIRDKFGKDAIKRGPR